MNESEFIPATDFERDNADIIKQIKSIGQESLSRDFDEKLAREIDKIPIGSLKRRKHGAFFLEKNSDPALYLSYAAAIFIVCFSLYAYLYGRHDHSALIPVTDGVKTKQTMVIQIPAGKKEITSSDGANDHRVSVRNNGYAESLHTKVLQNLHYGFVSEPSAEDVKSALRSGAFRKAITAYENPGLKDTVRVLVDLLEDK